MCKENTRPLKLIGGWVSVHTGTGDKADSTLNGP